jgi:hypothetical protein
MSTLEIAILATLGLTLLAINSLASLRCLRTLGRYGLPYLALVWFAPFIGAVYVLAKIRPKQSDPFTPLASNTTMELDNNPRTIQGDPWPTLSQPIPPQRRPRKR